MRLYSDFHTEQLPVPPFNSPTQVPLNKNTMEDPLNTSNEITTPMYGGKKSRRSRKTIRKQKKSRRGGKWRKSTRKSKKTPRGGRKSSRKSRKVIRGGFSLPPFITDFTRGVQYGAEQLFSDITTAPLAPNRNPNVAAQPYLQSLQ
jgi:hypothetical protein